MNEPALMDALKGIREDLTTTLARQTAEIKETGETSKATRAALTELESKYSQLEKSLGEEKQRNTDLEAKLGRIQNGEGSEEAKSLGAQFLESDAFKVAREGGRGVMRVKALDSGAGSAGTLIRPQRVGEILKPTVRVTVRDLLAQGNTTSNAIEYVRENVLTNAAAPVAENAAKPESNITFTNATANVRTIATWIRASKQVLDDAPQLQSYIDNRLIDMLAIVEDNQLLNGDGTGQNLQGLNTAATAYNRTTVGDSAIDVLRRARTQVWLAGFAADGIVLHPGDWEDIELAKGTDDRYLWVNVNDGGVPRLWRMPVVETTAQAEGTFLAGAFRLAAQVFDRQDATVEVFEQDADNVTTNRVTIRAEERLALAIYRPTAFVKGTFPA
jgi:HK97 family phage major capsid protein